MKKTTALRLTSALAVLVCCVLLVRWYYPDGVFFDARTIYYDVSDLVPLEPTEATRFASTQELVDHLQARFEPHGKHYGPCTLLGVTNKPELIAWGPASEHYHLRCALSELEAEAER